MYPNARPRGSILFGDHPAVSKSASTEELRAVIGFVLGIDAD